MKHLFVLILSLFCAMNVVAQNATVAKSTKPNVTVDAAGNFHATVNAVESAVKTEKIYTDKEGTIYPVYKSKNGKYFVWKTSKKTGKEYKYYLNLPKQ